MPKWLSPDFQREKRKNKSAQREQCHRNHKLLCRNNHARLERQPFIPAFHERRFFHVVKHEEDWHKPEQSLEWDGIKNGHFFWLKVGRCHFPRARPIIARSQAASPCCSRRSQNHIRWRPLPVSQGRASAAQ